MKLVSILEGQVYDQIGPLLKQAYHTMQSGQAPNKELSKLRKIQAKLAKMGHPAADMVKQEIWQLLSGAQVRDPFQRAMLDLR